MKLKEKFQRFWTLSKSREGFTLVELIVVIAILAILAGVAIPVYNGYIKKANTAADQTLLDSVNTSFVAALAENGYSQYDVKTAVLPLSSGAVTSLTLVTLEDDTNVTTDIKEAFDFYFAGNESAKFNTFKAIKFDATTGQFVESAVMTFSYNGVEVTIDPSAIQAFQSSNWGSLASKDVLTLVGSVTGLAQSIDNSTFEAMMGQDAYKSAAAAALGVSADKYEETLEGLINQKIDEYQKANPNATDDDINAQRAQLAAQMAANNAVLVAAKGAETSGSNIMGILTENGGKDAKESIKQAMASDPSAGLSQAALAYGLYSSYMLEKDPDNFNVNAPMDFSAVLNTMEDADFQEYLTEGNGQQDLDGYLAALGAVSGNSGTGGIGTDVLVNGFDNDELAALLQQAMGK